MTLTYETLLEAKELIGVVEPQHIICKPAMYYAIRKCKDVHASYSAMDMRISTTFGGTRLDPQELTPDFLSKFDAETREQITKDYASKGFSLLSGKHAN